MHSIERLVDDMHFDSGDRFATVWGKVYGNWITDEVIDTEVLRNILLALLCVMGCTLALIANLQVCLYIFVCVVLTLVIPYPKNYYWLRRDIVFAGQRLWLYATMGIDD